jgi:hypothetical protein
MKLKKKKSIKKRTQNKIARDEIKNKIQLETINVNKTIAIKRRRTESK